MEASVKLSLARIFWGRGGGSRCPPLSVSLDCALTCYTLLTWFSRIKHVNICTKLMVSSTKRTMFLIMGSKNVWIHVQIRYIQNKSLWLLSVASRLEFRVSSVFFSTVDQISVTNSCHIANTHFPSKCVCVCVNEKEAPWVGSRGIRNRRTANINNVQKRRRWRFGHVSLQRWICLKDASINSR